MRRKLTKIAMSLALALALVPTMGSDGCDRGGYGCSAFDFGFDYFPSFGGFDFFGSSYEESYYYDDYYYGGDYYYEDYYYDDFYGDFWKSKNGAKPGK